MGIGMNIRAIKVRLATVKGDFGFKFEFGRGLTVIRGSNSSGKSTLFNCLAGDFPPNAGSIAFLGHDVTRATPEAHARLGIV